MAEQQSEAKVESHDPDFPEAFLQFMRSGWRDEALENKKAGTKAGLFQQSVLDADQYLATAGPPKLKR